MLIEIYQNIMGFKSEFSGIQSNLNRLIEAAEKNKALVVNFQAEKETDPLY
jgi:primosomal protein N''